MTCVKGPQNFIGGYLANGGKVTTTCFRNSKLL